MKQRLLTYYDRLLAKDDTVDTDTEGATLSKYGFAIWCTLNRTYHGLTMDELAEESGINRDRIWSIENGDVSTRYAVYLDHFFILRGTFKALCKHNKYKLNKAETRAMQA